jgi:hypothetical protein
MNGHSEIMPKTGATAINPATFEEPTFRAQLFDRSCCRYIGLVGSARLGRDRAGQWSFF